MSRSRPHNPSTSLFQLVCNWLLNASRGGCWFWIMQMIQAFCLPVRACPIKMAPINTARAEGECIHCRSARMGARSLRYRAVASSLVEGCDASPVLPMDREHAISFLEKKSVQKIVNDDMESLAAALDYMPPAIGFWPDHS